MSDRYELFLTCPKGLEGLLIEEAVGLGLEEAREHTSAVRGMATMETAYRLCLWSRDRKSTRLNSSHACLSRMPSSA